HHHHRHGAAEHFADFRRTVAGGVDDDFAADFAFRGFHHPFAVFAAHAGNGAEADDLCTQVTRALGQRLRQLRGVDVAVVRIVKRALKVVGFDERIAPLDLVCTNDFDIHALIATHALGALEFAHALLGVPKPQRTGDVVVHRVANGV